jgi:protein-S-isoprenylcysteine O-methyltransferase Ste14
MLAPIVQRYKWDEYSPYMLRVMSLIKASLTFVSAMWLHVASTPPNAPPPEAERVRVAGVESVLTRVVRIIPYIFKVRQRYSLGFILTADACKPQVGVMVASACEITVIVARRCPSNPIAMQFLSFLIPNPDIRAAQKIHATQSFLVGCLLANLGGFIRLSCFRTLGRLFTYELAVRKHHKLVTTGPYAIVRHPAYTGGFIMLFGAVLCQLSSGSWLRESGVLEIGVVRGLVEVWVALLIAFQGMVFKRVKQEDDALRAAFGKSWDIWAAKIRYRLVPGVY